MTRHNQQTYRYKGKVYTSAREVALLADVTLDKVYRFKKEGRSLDELDVRRRQVKDQTLIDIKVKGKIYRNIAHLAREFHCSEITARRCIKMRDAGLDVEDIWLED